MEFNKTDKVVPKYIDMLEDAIKTNKKISYPDFVIPYEYKSPSTAILFSQLNLLPPLMLYMGYGTLYSQSREQNRIFPAPAGLSLLGTGITVYSLFRIFVICSESYR